MAASSAIDAGFQAFGIPASFQPVTGASSTVFIMWSEADEVIGLGKLGTITESYLLDVRVSEIADLKKNDLFVVGAETFKVIAKPRRDAQRLVWQNVELNKQ